MVRALLGGLAFEGGDPWANYTIGPNGLEGWFDGVATRRDREARPRQHGEFPARGFLTGRVVTISGRINSAGGRGDTAAQEADIERLVGLLADGSEARLVVEGAKSTLWALVGRVDKPLVEVVLPGRIARYQASFWAPDPRRYSDGTPQATPPPSTGLGLAWPVKWPAKWPGGGTTGRVRLVNEGDFEAWPEFRLEGGFSSALITCTDTGARIGFAAGVLPGSAVVLSTHPDRRDALLDGQSNVSRYIRFREWEPIPPRSSRTFQFNAAGATGSARMIGRVDSAWS